MITWEIVERGSYRGRISWREDVVKGGYYRGRISWREDIVERGYSSRT